jgi:hypothetical protein
MPSNDAHATNRDLVLLLDDRDDTSPALTRVRRHVSACTTCAAQLAKVAHDLGALGHATRAGAGPLPSPQAARARLLAALDAGTAAGWPAYVPWSAVVGLGAATLVLAALTWQTLDAGRPDRVPAPVAAAVGPVLPRPDLTPGAVREVGGDEICSGEPAAGIARPSVVPQQVFAAYGVDYQDAGAYELDFLITPELGGAAEAGNLWPQPYHAVLWNAHVKDELERELHRLVCEGTLEVTEAHRELAVDWIASYKRRFGTERPRRDYRQYPLTAFDVEALRGEAAEQSLLAVLR